MSDPAVPMAPRRGLWRWFVALMATVLLVVAGSGLVAFAQSGAAASQGPTFVPAGSPVYLEARLDMPDGQGDALAQMLTAFPGFADASSFPTKSDEVIGAIVEMATGDTEGLAEISQYLTGELGLTITELTPEVMESDTPPMVIGLAISDRAAVEGIVAGLIGDDAAPQTIGSATVYSDEDAAVAIADGWVLISPRLADVEAAVAALDGDSPSLASDPEFQTAFARVPGGHLGALYVDMQSFGSLIELALAQSEDMGMGMEAFGAPMDVEALVAALPVDMVAYLAAEPDRLTLEAFMTPGEGMPDVPLGESAIPELFPADTQLYLETRELGATISTTVGQLVAMMGEESAQGMAPIEDMLGVPLPELLDFVSDAGVGAGVSPESLWLGIAAEVTDEAVAAQRVERLLSIIRLFAAGEDSGVTVATQSIGGVDATVITLPIDEAQMGLPFSIGQTITVAVADGHLLIGSGDFVENALTADPATSLGASPGWTDAIGEDTANSGVVYANIGSLLAALDPLLSAAMPEWSEIAPYATALDRLVVVGSADEDVLSARMSVIVAQ